MTTSQINKIIGKNIRERRLLAGITQEQLAEVLSISPAFVGLIERGKRGVKTINLIKLADIFNTTVNDLLSKENCINQIEINKSAGSIKKSYISALVSHFTDLELNFIIAILEAYNYLGKLSKN